MGSVIWMDWAMCREYCIHLCNLHLSYVKTTYGSWNLPRHNITVFVNLKSNMRFHYMQMSFCSYFVRANHVAHPWKWRMGFYGECKSWLMLYFPMLYTISCYIGQSPKGSDHSYASALEFSLFQNCNLIMTALLRWTGEMCRISHDIKSMMMRLVWCDLR